MTARAVSSGVYVPLNPVKIDLPVLVNINRPFAAAELN